MKKKIGYIILFLFICICFNKNASALTCKYAEGSVSVDFEINGDGSVADSKGYFEIKNSSKPGEDSPRKSYDIVNWNKSLMNGIYYFEVPFSGKEFYETTQQCPQYILVTYLAADGWIDLVVAGNDLTAETIESRIKKVYEKYGIYDKYYKLELVRQNDDMLTQTDHNVVITTYANYPNDAPFFPEKPYPFQYDDIAKYKLKPNTYEFDGYDFVGWYVKNSKDEWLCNQEKKLSEYKKDCSEENRVVVEDEAPITFYINTNGVNLYAKWKKRNDISALNINTANLGESICKKSGYVWNKEGYCNTDNLQYVMCGDAHDIPAQLPSIISMLVNLLKIVTPIVLIIVSIITLVKATMASKEDEIKKAQQSLIRKVIASVMAFMIISIVQFVILKVADNKDQTSISACLSCFLNNDCTANKYFKTNVKGTEYCSKVSNKGKNSEICGNSFYNKNTSKDPNINSDENLFTCNVGEYIIKFNALGYPVSATTKSGKEVEPNFGTDFYPKNSSECPTDSNAIAGIKDGTLWILKKADIN